MLMLMLTSVCDEEGEDDEVVVDIDDYVDVDVHVRVDVDVDVDVYELFDNCIVTGWITNPSLRITLCLSWKKDRMEGRFIKLCIAKTKTKPFSSPCTLPNKLKALLQDDGPGREL